MKVYSQQLNDGKSGHDEKIHFVKLPELSFELIQSVSTRNHKKQRLAESYLFECSMNANTNWYCGGQSYTRDQDK